MFSTIESLDWARQGSNAITFGAQGAGTGFKVYTLDIASDFPEIVVNGDHPCRSPDNSHITFVTFKRLSTKINSIELVTGDMTTFVKGGNIPDWGRK